MSEPRVELDVDDEKPEDEDEDIDPAIKANFLPMAMSQAKKAVGDERKSLPGNEHV